MLLSSLPSFTSLRVQGKVTAAAIKHIAKQPFVKRLVDFQIAPRCKGSLNDKMFVLSFAESLTKLTLHFEQENVHQFYPALIDALRKARGHGTKPLLTHLSISDYSGGCLPSPNVCSMFWSDGVQAPL